MTFFHDFDDVLVLERMKNLEKQLEESRSECLQLRRQLSAMESGTKPTDTMAGNRQKTEADSEARPLSKDSVIVANHLQQLNGVIGNLRAEKLDLTTQLRKQQLRISHLENLVDQLSKQVSINALHVLCHICAMFVRKELFLNGPLNLKVRYDLICVKSAVKLQSTNGDTLG